MAHRDAASRERDGDERSIGHADVPVRRCGGDEQAGRRGTGEDRLHLLLVDPADAHQAQRGVRIRVRRRVGRVDRAVAVEGEGREHGLVVLGRREPVAEGDLHDDVGGPSRVRDRAGGRRHGRGRRGRAARREGERGSADGEREVGGELLRAWRWDAWRAVPVPGLRRAAARRRTSRHP